MRISPRNRERAASISSESGDPLLRKPLAPASSASTRTRSSSSPHRTRTRHLGCALPDQTGRPDPVAVGERRVQEHHVRLGALRLGYGLQAVPGLPDDVEDPARPRGRTGRPPGTATVRRPGGSGSVDLLVRHLRPRDPHWASGGRTQRNLCPHAFHRPDDVVNLRPNTSGCCAWPGSIERPAIAHHPVADGERHRLETRVDLQLRKDVLHVRAYGVGRDPEGIRDALAGRSPAQQREHLPLSRRELLRDERRLPDRRDPPPRTIFGNTVSPSRTARTELTNCGRSVDFRRGSRGTPPWRPPSPSGHPREPSPR